MKLCDALRNLKDVRIDENLKNLDVHEIKIKPDALEKGDIFVCLKNGKEGENLICEAMKKEPSVIVCEKAIKYKNHIVVDDSRKAFSLIAKGLSNNACDKMKIVAVTGTNGKTSVVKLLADILRLSGKKVGTIGTLGSEFDNKSFDTGFTTPDPDILHHQFELMQKAGIEFVVMEASAHAIELRKLEGIKFEFSLLTNVTQDHLDFFQNMENYYGAKAKLFSSHYTKNAIICGDDSYGERLAEEIKIPCLTYGFDEKNNIKIENFSQNEYGMVFTAIPLKNVLNVKSKLVGSYNAQNLLASIICAIYLGVKENTIEKTVPNLLPPEGRFNVISYKGVNIIIDYAHTPDGLENILKSAKEITKCKLLCVFGCGGNRDKLKRPIMGEIASKYANMIYLTSDNPRFEKPEVILEEIEKGIETNYVKIVNRAGAIERAINDCSEGDTIVIAGKGAEKYQEINGEKTPYSDFDVVKKIIKKRECERK